MCMMVRSWTVLLLVLPNASLVGLGGLITILVRLLRAKPAVPAQPAGPGADIPSKYGLGVTASATPLAKFPRPQMVRGAGATETLRDVGDPKVWTNLNGLWEWEASAATDASAPPFGKTLSGSILVSSFRPSSAA